jgi:V/A-type H+-transporting ATPase subunit K
MEDMRKWGLRANGFLAVVALVLLAIGAAILVSPAPAQAEESEARELVVAQVDSSVGYAFIAAAVAVGLSCIAAGIAVAAVGAAAMGAVAERPELMGRSIIFVGLAEGIAIYGLIVAIIMLGKI